MYVANLSTHYTWAKSSVIYTSVDQLKAIRQTDSTANLANAQIIIRHINLCIVTASLDNDVSTEFLLLCNVKVMDWTLKS